jgi:hypothetical protein
MKINTKYLNDTESMYRLHTGTSPTASLMNMNALHGAGVL